MAAANPKIAVSAQAQLADCDLAFLDERDLGFLDAVGASDVKRDLVFLDIEGVSDFELSINTFESVFL